MCFFPNAWRDSAPNGHVAIVLSFATGIFFVGGCGCCVPTFWFRLSWTKFGWQFLTVLSLVMEKAAALLKAVQCHDYRISGEIHAIQLCSDVWKTWTKQWLARYQNRLRRCHLPRWDARSTSFCLGNRIRRKSSIWRCVALSTQPKPQQVQLRLPESALFFCLNFDYTQRQLHWEVIVVPQEGKCWYIVQLGKSSLSEVHSTHHSNNGHVVCLLVRPWFCFLLERCTQHFSKDVGIWAWCWWPAKTQCPYWRHPEQNRKFQRFEVRYCQVCWLQKQPPWLQHRKNW